MAYQSLFGDNPTIEFPDNAEAHYTMGGRIGTDVDGFADGIRYWGSTGTIATSPDAAVWNTSGGAPLVQEPFGAFVAGGWNVKMLTTPFPMAAGGSWIFGGGVRNRYAATRFVFTSPLHVGDLTGYDGRFLQSLSFGLPDTITTTWYGFDILFRSASEPFVRPSITVAPHAAAHRAGSW